MPTYTFSRKIDTQRKEAAALIQSFFAHLDPMGLTLTGMAISTSGGTRGNVSMTVAETLTAEQIAHLGLT